MTNAEVFPPFRAAQPAGAEPVKPARKQKVAKPASPKATQAKGKKARKPRPVSLSLDVLPALAGMSEVEVGILKNIIGLVQSAKKQERTRIVAALGKVFR